MAIPLSFYKFSFPYHSMTSTYKIYGQRPYILKDYFDMMLYLSFYKVNVFSYILYGHSLIRVCALSLSLEQDTWRMLVPFVLILLISISSKTALPWPIFQYQHCIFRWNKNLGLLLVERHSNLLNSLAIYQWNQSDILWLSSSFINSFFSLISE